MSDNLLTSVDFEKYLSLINGLFTHACELAVFGVDGTAVFTNSAMDRSELARAVTLPKGHRLAEAESWEKVQVRKLDDGKTVYSLGMVTESDDFLGVLVLIVNQDSLPDGVYTFDEFRPLVENLAAFIKNECKLTKELNAMANELGERYEELNLVYDTDDYVQELDEVHRSLKRIVENCVTYLGVSMALLSLPRKNIVISYSDDARPISESKAVIENASNVLYQKLKGSVDSIVLNDLVEVQEVCPGVTCKILSSPILGADGQLDGIIVTTKNRQSPDYNNSDRNLLEVMSKKVMQVIQANYDTLTGLLNRAVFELHVEESLLIVRQTNSIHTILAIDLDDLQVTNDTFSYQVGDNLIKTVAGVIQEQVRDTDIVSRIGGDEFGVLLENCPLEAGVRIANKIRQAISNTGFVWDNKKLEISATIGVALIDANTQSSASILSESELARDTAKDLGKNRVHVFQSEDGELLRRKDQMQWVTRIKSALREDRFVIYGQPIVPLQDSSVPHHIEILLRLQDEDGSILAPWTFLPSAERYHLMPEIDRWVVNQTLTTLSEQNNRHAGIKIKVAINLSGQSLGNEEFLDFLLHRLDQVDFSLENICFEVTESAAISNLAEAQHFMSVLKEKGCRFSLDDFGTGLSSFAYLKNLPVDYLKIDGSFVKEIVNDPISDAMVSAINQVGQVMGLKTIAEFVENDAIKDHLKKLGVNYAQGYGVGKPRPILEQLEDMLQ